MEKLNELQITIIKANDEVKMINDKSDELVPITGTPSSNGDLIVFFGNFYNDDSLYNVVRDILLKFETDDVEEYLLSKYNEISDRFGNVVAMVIFINSINAFVKNRNRKHNVKSVISSILKCLNSICLSADTYAMLAEKASRPENYFLYALNFEVLGTFNKKVHYGVYPFYVNGELKIYDIFTIDDWNAALSFDLACVAKEHTTIKKCENCGKYFVPASRSDEKYCDNIFRNGKTCKQVAFIQRLESDVILKAYRKIYKTQNARKQRNSHNTNTEARFDSWKLFAKSKLDDCQNKLISLDEMINLISGDEWLKEVDFNGNDKA